MSRKLKIAVIAACPFPYPRGTPIRILRMAEGLTARGHEVHVITYHLGQTIDDLPFTIHRIPNIPTYHKFSPGPTYQKVLMLDTLLAIKILNVIRNNNIDIIHAHHYEGLLASLPAARITNTPLVFDVHTLLSSELPHYPMGLPQKTMHWIGNIFDLWLPQRADHIVSVTNYIREKLISEIKINPDRITTVYTGIEADHFSVHSLPKPASISQTLIYTGNLAPYQGVSLMLQAFRKVVDHKPDTKLKIVTNSSIAPYTDMISTLDFKDNIIIEDADYFQLPAQLHTARIALNPRVRADGLPVKLLNYMATGRSIVSFEGSSEILEHAHTGLVIPNDDIDEFANAILNLLENPELAKKLGQNAQSRVQEFFVWEKSIILLEDIYEKIMGQSS